MTHAAVILDRDGTLIRDTGYLSNPNDVEWLPGVLDALKSWQDEGRLLVIVTNQSGIGRGLYSEADYQRVTRRLEDSAAEAGIIFKTIRHCPHDPDAHCRCRKPAPGLVNEVILALDLDPTRSVAIGDRTRDLEAARAAGIETGILVEKDRGLADVDLPPL